MLAKAYAPAHIGLDSRLIEVECDLSNGLPGFIVVGLPDKPIEEAKERLRGAFKNQQLKFPPKRITVNLAPADLPKDGSAYDLAMAAAILAASGQIDRDLSDCLMVGELALNGTTRPTKGVLASAQLAQKSGLNKLFVSEANAREAALIKGLSIFPVKSLWQLYRHLIGEAPIEPAGKLNEIKHDVINATDLNMIYGQDQAKRAIEVAAAGGHNLLLSGPPGSGKTMLAQTLPGLLPRLSESEMIEVTKIHSLAHGDSGQIVTRRPFRNPHHTASSIALIGGGRWPKPGEISLSHLGVLFLDELPEFQRSALEVLRQPLEDGCVTVARAAGSVTFPAKFMLIATRNPCPCGYAGDPAKDCRCSLAVIGRYHRKISGPLLDRIDLTVEVSRVKKDSLLSASGGESSAAVARRIAKCRQLQANRQGPNRTNSELTNQEIQSLCGLNTGAEALASSAIGSLSLSARAYFRLLKVARTIADLKQSPIIESAHIAEALQYRARA